MLPKLTEEQEKIFQIYVGFYVTAFRDNTPIEILISGAIITGMRFFATHPAVQKDVSLDDLLSQLGDIDFSNL